MSVTSFYVIRRGAYTVSGGSVNPPFSRRARRLFQSHNAPNSGNGNGNSETEILLEESDWGPPPVSEMCNGGKFGALWD